MATQRIYTYGNDSAKYSRNKPLRKRASSGVLGEETEEINAPVDEFAEVANKCQPAEHVWTRRQTWPALYKLATGKTSRLEAPEPAVADNDAIADAVTRAFKSGATEAQIREKMLASGLKLAVVDKYLPRTAKKAPAFDFGL